MASSAFVTLKVPGNRISRRSRTPSGPYAVNAWLPSGETSTSDAVQVPSPVVDTVTVPSRTRRGPHSPSVHTTSIADRPSNSLALAAK